MAMRRSITFFQKVHQVAKRLAIGLDPMSPVHPTPALEKAWKEMRALCDSEENKKILKN